MSFAASAPFDVTEGFLTGGVQLDVNTAFLFKVNQD
jgi:hypothetical protein